MAGDAEPLRREDALAADRLGLRGQRIESRVRPRELTVQRVEAKERRVRLRRESGVLGAEVVSALEQRGRGVGAAGARQRDSEERTDEHRDRSHRQSCWPGGHGAAP